MGLIDYYKFKETLLGQLQLKMVEWNFDGSNQTGFEQRFRS